MKETELKVYRPINMGIVKEWIEHATDFIRMTNETERQRSVLSPRNTHSPDELANFHPFYRDNPECHNLLQLWELDSEYGHGIECYESYFLGASDGLSQWGYKEILSEQDFETVRGWVLEHNKRQWEQLEAAIKCVEMRTA